MIVQRIYANKAPSADEHVAAVEIEIDGLRYELRSAGVGVLCLRSVDSFISLAIHPIASNIVDIRKASR